MSKHTPGPWREQDGHIYGGSCHVCDPRCLPPTEFNMALMDANARLIAAAPELLAAVKHFRAEFWASRLIARKLNPKRDFSLMTAEAALGTAIAKAEGGA